MISFFSRLADKFYREPADRKRLKTAFKRITGYQPGNIGVYIQALRHTSVSKNRSIDSNERLEFLGDAVLGAVTGDYLFKKFPYKEEGFLTQIRSRIVNRESLNWLANQVGLDELVEYHSHEKSGNGHKSVHGNALEALIGAVYLDKGFYRCKKFIIQKLLLPYFDFQQLTQKNFNFKSILLEWAQKNDYPVNFEIIDEKGTQHQPEFQARVLLNNEEQGRGKGTSKKKAEQNAAREACEQLQITGAS